MPFACLCGKIFLNPQFLIRHSNLTGFISFLLLQEHRCWAHPLGLGYNLQADHIEEGRRAAAFGMLAGVGSSAFVCGTLSARFLSTSSTFQVSAFVAVLATVYMKTFLVDSGYQKIIDATSPLLSNTKDHAKLSSADGNSCPKMRTGKKIPSVTDMVQLLSSSLTFTQAAVVAFFSSLAESGLHASLLFYLKAQFQFNKDQFADLMLIAGLAGAISQLLLMPMLAPCLDEVKLLRIGLFAACANVPYLASSISVLAVFGPPCIRSIASKQVGPEEQGKGQGCISGMCSFANIVSPLTFTPLTALFLSERAPFHFPGFSIMCTGFAMMVAFVQSTIIRAATPISSGKISSSTFVEP
ncbi:hypothetical protein IFM89_027583 [Coptis chinensis]|uniref:Uncharacterized protein n=1 Tax=Coptis chinensis TaxID=261450 RepID=A0A835MC79_9MAGN|nr:hypothetical protein IFM89_027583 [Coptis chinensis]